MNMRELLGDDHWRMMQRDYEDVRRWLKAGAQPRELLPVYRAFESFYKKFLD